MDARYLDDGMSADRSRSVHETVLVRTRTRRIVAKQVSIAFVAAAPDGVDAGRPWSKQPVPTSPYSGG